MVRCWQQQLHRLQLFCRYGTGERCASAAARLRMNDFKPHAYVQAVAVVMVYLPGSNGVLARCSHDINSSMHMFTGKAACNG